MAFLQKSAGVFLLSLIIFMSFSGCTQTQSNEIESQSFSQSKQSSLASDSSLHDENASIQTANEAILDDDIPSDEDLVDRTLYLFDIYVFPVGWWIGANEDALCVKYYEGLEPLENTPEYTAFYQVLRFNSIDEMKRATEQVVTKDYAENNLYPFLEENRQFLERDGKLYINIEGGCGMPPFGPISATVLSKTKNEAELSVVFQAEPGEEEVHKIELKRESGTWKLNNYPFLD